MRHFDFSHNRSAYLRRTKPTLPEDMRRLIDDAVQAGRITHVPRGVSGLPRYRFVGIEAAPRSGGFMEVRTDETGAEVVVPLEAAKDKAQAKRVAGTRNLRRANEAKKERAAHRQATIWQMHTDGVGLEGIAAAVGTTPSAVFWQLKKIKADRRAQGLPVAATEASEGAA